MQKMQSRDVRRHLLGGYVQSQDRGTQLKCYHLTCSVYANKAQMADCLDREDGFFHEEGLGVGHA